ncbi:MAG: dihydrodipicolinate synthase [Frankiales bacterium]|nr:dihydrodipicolinate synthase [Frankiales bacterium]
MTTPATAPFGRVLTAMVTPMNADGSMDLEGGVRLAKWLLDNGNDGLIVNGTTGESPTTTDAENRDLVSAIVDAVPAGTPIVAGVGTNDTEHTLRLAGDAEMAGATGLLVVTPYYNKPPQAGLIAHFEKVANSTDLPVMLYDIPGRSGVPIQSETIVKLARHPQIIALKDAKGDIHASAQVIADTDLAYYSGDDAMDLPLFAVGAVGVVGVSTHVLGTQTAEMLETFLAGNVAEAAAMHRRLLPAYLAMNNQSMGAINVKAALTMLGLPAGPVRLPLIDATTGQREALRQVLTAAGVVFPDATGPDAISREA